MYCTITVHVGRITSSSYFNQLIRKTEIRGHTFYYEGDLSQSSGLGDGVMRDDENHNGEITMKRAPIITIFPPLPKGLRRDQG